VRLRRRLAAFVEIRRGEGTKTVLMFLYFFLLLTSYYVLKPVRNSLFLENLGPRQLPYVYLATALIIGFVVAVYARLMERFERHLLIMASTVFFASNLVLFWWFFSLEVGWMAGLLYLWAAIFSVGAVTQFWSIANEIFNPEEAKRLFGLVGGGGVLGGVVGGLLSNLLVRRLGTENLLLVSAAFLVPCIGIIALIHRLEERFGREAAPARRSERPLAEHEPPLKTVMGSSYLQLLALMMIVMVVVATLVDFEFNSVAAGVFPGKDAKTAFFGAFFAAVSALSLLVQFFLTSPVLRLLGVGAALLLLPLSLLGASLSVLVLPALWAASALKLADGSLRYSLNQATREILFLPVPLADKYTSKAFIDVTLQRWARGGAALLILAAIALNASWVALALVTMAFCAAWVWVVLRARERYLLSLSRLLDQRLPRPPEPGLLERPGAKWPELTWRGATAFVAAAERGLVARLLSAPDPRVRAAALQRLTAGAQPASRAQLESLLEDPDAVVRERAYVLLCAQCGPGAVAAQPWIDPAAGRPPQLAADTCAIEARTTSLLTRRLPEARVRAATLLAASPRPANHLVAALAWLITDASPEVGRAACATAARLQDERLVPSLLRALALPWAGPAAEALVSYGPPVASLIAPALRGAAYGRMVAGRVCEVLATVGGEEAVGVLEAALERPAFRLYALRALARVEPPPGLPSERIEGGYREALAASARATVVLGDWEAFRGGTARLDLLGRALLQAQHEGLEEAMLWQELLRPERRLAATIGGLNHWAKELRAASQELLESALPREARRLLALVLSERSAEEKADGAATLAQLPRRHFLAWLPELLADAGNPALRLGAICAAATHPSGGYRTELARIARTGSSLESSLARAALPQGAWP
jgi:ATP/ADP translocase